MRAHPALTRRLASAAFGLILGVSAWPAVAAESEAAAFDGTVVPLDAPLPARREGDAGRALERAREVGEEYEDVGVHTEIVRARKVGAGIVEAARRTGAEAIVIGGEEPTKIRGGATLGGIGAARPAEIGAATEYVLKKAPCRVLLTAPPALG